MGYYKVPNDCDLKAAGSCDLSITWSRRPQQRVGFDVTARSAKQFVIGFSYRNSIVSATKVISTETKYLI